ncbi:MAG: BadF/BadG/BcrA/BcrD ATPase family protein [Flavobacteriales bacterium]|jgi:N-acetylglucosamine kinase-like BadF-type ATPase|tara:strand:+ start:4071 stop:4925 length:855 start_codon:yes stop_codon:yes gene_type:complete
MILIVDSGSTKTDWIAINEKGEILFQTQTLGLNPQVLTDYIIEERIVNNFDLYQNRKSVTKLYFYGAGCGTEPPRVMIKGVFQNIFKSSEILVKEDTFAAVYATAEINKESIVCILGTGSNCSYFDGVNVIQKITSLGYILMDDGSGNYFGRQLLRDYYFNRIPELTANRFEEDFDLGAETIKNHLYKKPNPNTYLAKFARFLIENKENKYAQKLIKKGMKLFVKRQILQFPNAKELPIHFTGSIAYYLRDELKQVLKKHGLKAGNIVKRPIDGLLKYHINLLD